MKYDVILADPPWQYRTFQGAERSSAARHYSTSPLEVLSGWDVGSLATDRALLALWTTGPNLNIAFDLAKHWGFPYYNTILFAWAKRCKADASYLDVLSKKAGSSPREAVEEAVYQHWHLGNGYSTRANVELCLSFWRSDKEKVPRLNKGVRQLIVSPVQRHSEKPDEANNRLTALYGDVPRCELFARRPLSGWDVWGNEVESAFQVPVKQGWTLSSTGSPQRSWVI